MFLCSHIQTGNLTRSKLCSKKIHFNEIPILASFEIVHLEGDFSELGIGSESEQRIAINTM